MLIGVKCISGKANKTYDYSLDGQPLIKVSEEKDLGVGPNNFQRLEGILARNKM